MPDVILDEDLDFEEDFDPLAVDDLDINQDEMDDDNPYDVADYPTMRNMPDGMRRAAVFTPENKGGAGEALRSLLDYNPARRPILLSIIDLCREGCAASVITERISALQTDNRSVYAPSTLCRMLERAGALELEMPEATEEHEDEETGAGYLVIKERVDPIWHATDEALAVYDSMTDGSSFRELILGRDGRYAEVYRAVMEALAEQPRSKKDIEEIVDVFEIVQHPRRFGGHFIDMLERVDAIVWKDRSWQLSDLGARMLDEMREGEGR